MTHAPMTYVSRCYYSAYTRAKFVVYFCTKDGKRLIQEFSNAAQSKAFTDALDGLGFTRKRR